MHILSSINLYCLAYPYPQMCLTLLSDCCCCVQSSSHVQLFVTPWTAAYQASLSLTTSWSLPKFMSIASLMPSSYLILQCPLLLLPQSLPASGAFPMSQLFVSEDQFIGVSASASVLPMSIQGWFPLRLTSLITLCPRKEPSGGFSSTTIWRHQFFSTMFYLQYSSHNCTSRFHMYSLIYLFFSFWLT